MAPTQEWGHHLFIDHPLSAARNPKNPVGFADKSMSRKKIFCKRCFNAAVQWERSNDAHEIQTGARLMPRTDKAIEEYVWSGDAKKSNPLWTFVAGRLETIFRHIHACPHSTQEEKDHAEVEMKDRRWIRAGAASPRRGRNTDSGDSIQAPIVFSPVFGAGGSLLMPSVGGSGSQAPQFHQPQISPSAIGSSFLFGVPTMTSNSPNSSLPSPLLIPPHGFTPPASASESMAPSPNISNYSPSTTPQDMVLLGPARKRSRIHGSLSRESSLVSIRTQPWTTNDQERFATHLARITVSCGFSYRWVEDPEVISFFTTYIPGASRVSRCQISDKYIPREVSRIRAISMREAANKLATLQLDGWGGINFHHFIAFMITTDDRKLYTVKVYDTSSDRKTAEHLMILITEVREILNRDWKVKVIAITTDASGETKKARQICMKDDPSLIAPDCWAHQNALVVGDYMRICASTMLLAYASTANDIITWLRSKTQILGIMRDVQISMRGPERVLSVIRPVITRWTAYFLAYKRLIELLWVLRIMAQHPDHKARMLAAKTASARAKNAEMLRSILSEEFGVNLTKIVKHLEPLARSSCILQAAHARLDQVPLVFGSLLMEYSKLKEDPDLVDTVEQINVIESSIERRWKACDQSIYIAAMILHPLIKARPFSSSSPLNRLQMWVLIESLWKRFYPNRDVRNTLWLQFANYLDGTGQFAHMEQYAKQVKEMSDSRNVPADPIEMWRAMNSGSDNAPVLELHILAKHLFSACCNSASCERLFSMFGLILTKLRSRLLGKKMTETAELRLHLRDEHIANGTIGSSERLKRKTTSHGFDFVPTADTPSVSTDSVNPSESVPGVSQSVPTLQATASAISDEEVEQFLQEEGLTSTTNNSGTQSSFQNIVNNLSQAALEVETEDLDLDSQQPPSSSDINSLPKIPLTSLFNFRNLYWEELAKSSNVRLLQDELELHELLDKDTENDILDGEDANDVFYSSL